MQKNNSVGVMIIGIMITLIFGITCVGFGQEQQIEFTEQDKMGIAFAEEDALTAIKNGDIYIISGGEGNEPIVDQEDLQIIKGLPMKSIGCMGSFEYAKKFNKTIIDYLKEKRAQAQRSLSKEQIIEIAKSKAEELGFNLKEMTVFYDEDNQKLEEYPLLSGRDYQAVYFTPKELMLGGDLWIFIDKNTGEVITYVMGE